MSRFANSALLGVGLGNKERSKVSLKLWIQAEDHHVGKASKMKNTENLQEYIFLPSTTNWWAWYRQWLIDC